MHFFSFSSIFFHAPGVINCVFYQAEKFSEVDKTRIKKNLFLEKYILRFGKIWRVQIRSQICTRVSLSTWSFFSFEESSFGFFWRQNHASGKPSRNRVCSKPEKEEKKLKKRFHPFELFRKLPPNVEGCIGRTGARKNSLLGGKSLTSNDVFFFPKKKTAAMYFFFRTTHHSQTTHHHTPNTTKNQTPTPTQT